MALNTDWRPVDSPRLTLLMRRDAKHAEMTAVTNDLINQATQYPLYSPERHQLMDQAIANAILTDKTMAEFL